MTRAFPGQRDRDAGGRGLVNLGDVGREPALDIGREPAVDVWREPGGDTRRPHAEADAAPVAERPWRSLERRAEEAAAGGSGERLPERVRPEFAPGADLPPDGVTRRTVLGLMGASLALAGTTACRRPVEEIVPYVRQPEEVVPGIARHYATTLPLGASVLGVVVESHEGRPTKVEGNPDHPSSGGAASAWAQASILDLYDPDRLPGVTRRAEPGVAPAAATWADFAAWWQERGEAMAEGGGRGLAIVAGASTSPTLERLAGDLAARFPAARWIVHEPAGDQAIFDGAGQGAAAARPVNDLSRARRILVLDADLLHTESDAVANARGLAAARRTGAEAGGDAAVRLYVVEPVPTSTGAVADHRLRLPAGQIASFAAAVAEGLGVAVPTPPARQEPAAPGDASATAPASAEAGADAAGANAQAADPQAGPVASVPSAASAGAAALTPELRRRAALIAADLAAAPGAALVAAGRRQPAQVHALVRAINQRLGAPVDDRPVPRLAAIGRTADGASADLASLAAAIAADQIDTLVVLGGDPAYSAPGDLVLAERLASVPHRVVLAHDHNRTAEGAEWVLPLAHPFEAWGDARSADGTLSPIQPLIEPLFGGRSEIEVVALLATGEERPGHELVRETWQAQGLAGGDFERSWRRALHAGVVARGPAPGGGGEGGAQGAARPEGRPLDDGGRRSGDHPGEVRGEEGAGAAAAMAAGSADAGREEREPRDRAAAPPAAPGAARPAAEAGAVEPFAARTVEDGTVADGAVGLEEVASEESEPADPFAADTMAAEGAAAAPAARAAYEAPSWRDLELVFLVSPAVLDGRFAGNAWLQELPDPVTKLVWGNAALVAPATAAELGVGDGDEVLLTAGGRKLLAPVAVQPGQAERTVALALGYGRTAVGRAGRGVGVDAYRLRGSASPWIDRVALQRTGRRHQLTRTQEHWEIEGRDLTRFTAVGAAGAAGHREASRHAAGPGAGEHAGTDGADHGVGSEHAAAAGEHQAVQLWEPPALGGQYQWGMAVDLATCVGCNACVVACQSENNIPVVGPEQVRKGREMHWLRVDRYYAGTPEEPRFAFQPVPCMHCENAPCEQVCPVAATVHDAEGLNGMTYNRCIGTRYCSNNCPYKVRRFNFFNYTHDTPEIVRLAMNPDVTVRSRGVMEKCTYCVQRINEGKMRAKLAGRALADGEVKTACQQTCPADAIVFGDVSDPETRVSGWKRDGRDYVLLGELNNRPRTSYLARWINPHPEWEERA